MRKTLLISPLIASVSFYPPAVCYASISVHSAARIQPRCAAPLGWDVVAARQPRYVVFGEIHGTREAPLFLGNLACAIAAKGERVLVAIEQDVTDNPALRAAWRLPSGTFKNALRRVGWKGRRDGIGSEAMFAMMVRLHELKERGRKIDIVAFNGFSDEAQEARFANLPGQGPDEAAQAENISKAANAGKYDRVLVLTGNFHARKTAIDDGARSFEPMAKRLELYGPTMSFNLRFAAGTAWLCQAKPGKQQNVGEAIPRKAIVCGTFPLRGDKNLNRETFIQLGTLKGEESTRDYDGFAWVGKATASSPLIK